MPEIHGSCDPAFAAVRDAFAANFDRSQGVSDAGAAVALYAGGRPVADLWAGHSDAAGTRPWRRDTIVCVYSCTKGMAALCAHLLADRGRLDYDAPVANYWSEFAQAGKESVTVRELMSHRAGLPSLREPLGPGGLWDWDTVANALAAEEPHWEPGSAHGYHTLSFGHLVGELVRRIDGRDLGRFFREEVAEPLGLDFLIGFGPERDARVAELLSPPEDSILGPLSRAALDVSAERIERYDDPHLLTAPVASSRAWRAAQIPGANGHSDARSLARVYALLAGGGELDGVRLLGPDTIARATENQSRGPDRTILGVATSFGLGFMLHGADPPMSIGPGERAFGHNGAYGSIGLADPDAGIGFGYVLNRFGEPLGDRRGLDILDAAYACL